MAAVSRGQGQFQFCQVNMSVYSLSMQGTGAPKLLVQRGLTGTFSTTCLSCGGGTSTSWTLPLETAFRPTFQGSLPTYIEMRPSALRDDVLSYQKQKTSEQKKRDIKDELT